MKTHYYLMLTCIFTAFIFGNTWSQEQKDAYEFKGKIAKSYEESEEYWPKKPRPPEDAPNVIIFLLDDVGFGAAGTFGGSIETPARRHFLVETSTCGTSLPTTEAGLERTALPS